MLLYFTICIDNNFAHYEIWNLIESLLHFEGEIIIIMMKYSSPILEFLFTTLKTFTTYECIISSTLACAEIFLKHQVNWNTVCGAILDQP